MKMSSLLERIRIWQLVSCFFDKETALLHYGNIL